MTVAATPLDLALFAHNEAQNIGATITDLGRQTALSDPGLDLRVLILSNGSSDGTAEVAQVAIDALPEPMRGAFVVRDFPEGGKSRTVHRYIHEEARPEADLLGFMDADIRLPEPDTLAKMAAQFAARPKLHAFTSRPVKDVVHDNLPVGGVARVIAAGGDGLTDYRKSICGQLFMLRGSSARKLALPMGLPVEDGFIRAMTLTDHLTQMGGLDRIDGQDDIFHVYESIRSLPELIRHQTRIVIGSAVNAALFARIRREAPTEDAARTLLMEAAVDETWLSRVLREDLPRAPFGYVPFEFLTKRLKRGPGRRSLKGYVMLILGFGLDLLVWVLASVRMARGVGAGHW